MFEISKVYVTMGGKDIGIKKSEFVTKLHFFVSILLGCNLAKEMNFCNKLWKINPYIFLTRDVVQTFDISNYEFCYTKKFTFKISTLVYTIRFQRHRNLSLW